MNQRNGSGRGKGSRKPTKTEVTTEFLLLFYEAFLREYEITKVCAALDTTIGTLNSWLRKFPELQEAKTLAEKRRNQSQTFSGYVYKHLSAEAKQVWEKIQFWEGNQSTASKIESILSSRPTKLRQEIFVHALIHYGFNLSEACRIACVSRATMEKWKQSDLEFQQMIEEIEWHKKNFFEHALTDLVTMRNPGAVMFVNRTKNADRGYNEKIQVEHTGEIKTGIDIDQLELPMETRKQILYAVREQKAKQVEETKQLSQTVDV
jgi:hypothetical protein